MVSHILDCVARKDSLRRPISDMEVQQTGKPTTITREWLFEFALIPCCEYLHSNWNRPQKKGVATSGIQYFPLYMTLAMYKRGIRGVDEESYSGQLSKKNFAIWNKKHRINLQGTLEGVYGCCCCHYWSTIGYLGLNYRHQRLHRQSPEATRVKTLAFLWVCTKIKQTLPSWAKLWQTRRA